MSEEVKELIKTAIQMEKDGHEFYTKAAAQTSDDLGKKLFESIALDEMVHLRTFQKMFDDEMGEEEWTAVEKTAVKHKDIPVFPKDLKQVEGASPNSNEIDALNIAMKSEEGAIDYYQKIKEGLTEDKAKQVVEMIIDQEKNHFLLLSEELNHLNTTGFYYDVGPLGI
jgi:rubrerythrin